MNLLRSRRTPIQIKITTYAEVLDFQIDKRDKVKEIFDRVCNAISVREKWFFGLAVEENDSIIWLKSNKELLRQRVQKDANGVVQVKFLVKFYPESIDDELVLPNTQHLFYLQLKREVLTGRLQVAAEEAILLASYIVQAELGDMDDFDDVPPDLGNGQSWSSQMIEKIKVLQPVLPDYTLESNKQMTKENWYEEVFKVQQDHRGLSFEESKLEYIKLCSKVINFGVIYFMIKLGREFETAVEYWIGISSYGINLYSPEDKLNPRKSWGWTQVDDLNYKGRCFIIKPSQLSKGDKKPDEVIFHSESAVVNEIILELCQGNHHLFFQRRRADTIEVQQMKLTAREEKERRQQERNQLLRERDARKIAEQDKIDLRDQVLYFRDQATILQKEIDKLHIVHERTQISQEEINLMQLQISQKDAIIDDLKERLSSKQNEIDHLRQKLQSVEIQSRSVPQQEYLNYNYDRVSSNNTVPNQQSSTGQLYHPAMSPFVSQPQNENQESNQPNLSYAMAFPGIREYYQLSRDSERLKAEQSDQQLKMEAGFNQLRQDLEHEPSYPS